MHGVDGVLTDLMTSRWHPDIDSFEDPLALLTSRRFVAGTSYRWSSSPAIVYEYVCVFLFFFSAKNLQNESILMTAFS